MKTKSIFLLFLLLLAALPRPAGAYTERNILQHAMSRAQLAEYLVTGQRWVDFPAYADRAGWDSLTGASRERIIRAGEQMLDYEWKVVTATDYLEFERTGNRNVMENPFNENNYAIARLLLAELAEGKGRFVDQLANGVFHACEMTSWALSAHLINQPDHRSLPRYDYDLIDLTAGDLGNLLSWTYYFMHDAFDKLNPEISRRLYHELDRRIMRPYLENDSFWWMGVNYHGQMLNNWNPWCNSNSLMTFMLLEQDSARLADAVWRSVESVDKFLNYVHGDGACEEGPSYWGHASGKLLDYLVLLSDVTGHRVNFFDNAQVRNMAEYIANSYVGDGWVVNFADASAKGEGDAHLIFRFGKAIGSERLQRFAAYLNAAEPHLTLVSRDFFRILEDLRVDRELAACKAAHTTPAFTWYPETEFCYFKKGRAFVATKGGYNDESHNHNDVGTVSLWVDNTPVLIDAGVGTYTRQTFSSERYTIWTMQSNYHNLPVINGQGQAYGRKYRAREVKASQGQFSLDIAGAYPAKAGVRQWVRTYTVKNKQLEVRDKFELDNPSVPNQVNFMTWGEVSQTKAGRVDIRVNGVEAAIAYDKGLFDVNVETIPQTDPRLSRVWGKQVYRVSFTAKKVEAKGDYRFTISY